MVSEERAEVGKARKESCLAAEKLVYLLLLLGIEQWAAHFVAM